MLEQKNARTEHLNTPRLVADSAGSTVWKWDQQEPFGVNVPDENPSSLDAFEFPLRFPGQYADKETGLHYNYFRDYDASLGRYVESDPIGLTGGMNTYAYTDSRPLSQVDPLGQQSFSNPNVFVQLGVQASLQLILAGGSVSVSAAVTLPSGDICRVFTYCFRLGPGLFVGAGGALGGGGVSGGGAGLAGLSFGVGGDLGAGPAAGGQLAVGVSNAGSVTSFGAARGRGGFGYGASIGIEACYSQTVCTRAPCSPR